MRMTDGEIRRMFKLALEPAKEITILANLNGMYEWEIAEIVKDVKLDNKKLQYGAGHNKTQVEALGDKIDKLLAKHNVEHTSREKIQIDKRPWVLNLERYMSMEGYTDRALAQKLGLKDCTVRAWIRGECYPRMDVAIRLCETLHTNLNAIFWEA